MRFLIDEMFQPAVAEALRALGHDAAHVREAGLGATDDAVVAQVARAEQRAIVTENVADFVLERDVVVVFVLKANLPPGIGQANALARVLNRWAGRNPQPYVGHHWPNSGHDAD